jgi:signal transduction histidine kinase
MNGKRIIRKLYDLLCTSFHSLLNLRNLPVNHGQGLAVRVTQGGDGRPCELVLRVSDTGPGIAPELREKVFYPFFTTRARGSGLGLPSAQKIAAAHGGGIEIDSRPGACSVALRLPVEEGA